MPVIPISDLKAAFTNGKTPNTGTYVDMIDTLLAALNLDTTGAAAGLSILTDGAGGVVFGEVDLVPQSAVLWRNGVPTNYPISGLVDLLSDATSGDTIELPPYIFVGDYTFPKGITIRGVHAAVEG